MSLSHAAEGHVYIHNYRERTRQEDEINRVEPHIVFTADINHHTESARRGWTMRYTDTFHWTQIDVSRCAAVCWKLSSRSRALQRGQTWPTCARFAQLIAAAATLPLGLCRINHVRWQTSHRGTEQGDAHLTFPFRYLALSAPQVSSKGNSFDLICIYIYNLSIKDLI